MTAATTYRTTVRSFDHSHLAELPSYPQLRQAMSDLANQTRERDGDPVTLADFLAAMTDAAVTSPYGDCCDACRTDLDRPQPIVWPHAVHREGNWITGTYRCQCQHVWTCGYAVDLTAHL